MAIPYLNAAGLASVLSMGAAIDALEDALREGLDPGADPPRMALSAGDGELLVMPSRAADGFVVKLATIAPGNPAQGLPRIQGVVVVFDGVTHAPAALIDGGALTSLRTPAVSALAARYVSAPDASRLVVFGTGPQAVAHIEAMRIVRPIGETVIVGRDPAKALRLAAGLNARVGDPDDVPAADVIVCATTAREPLFDGGLVRNGACVIAVGSHEPDVREVDSALVRRSRLVVEEISTALAGAGDLVMSGADGASLELLSAVVRRGAQWDARRPTLVKTVGMAWEDAVVARAAVRNWARQGGAASG